MLESEFQPEVLFAEGAQSVFAMSDLVQDDTTTYSQSFGLLSSRLLGSQGAIEASIGGMTAREPFTVTTSAAINVAGILLDQVIYRDWLQVRVAVQVHDGQHNTKTSRNRVYMHVAQAEQGSVTGNCRPDGTKGTCVIATTVSSAWLTGGPLTVTYGWSSGETLFEAGVVTPQGSAEAVYTDNIVAVVAAKPLRRGEEFEISVYGRAANDIESAKFVVFLNDVDALEFVGTGSGTHEETWTYQFIVRTDGLTVVMNRKPDGVTQTSGPQDEQALVTARLRVKGAAPFGTTSLEVRVQELNAPTPVSPGGQQIPEGGYVLGHVVGEVASQQSAGNVTIVDDEMLGVFASPVDGHGTVVNTAPLEGSSKDVRIAAYGVYRYGQTLRSEDVTGCTSTDADLGDAPLTSVDASGLCQVRLSVERGDEGYGQLDVRVETAHGDGIAVLRIWAPVVPLTVMTDTTTLMAIRMWDGGPYMLDEGGCGPRFLTTRLRVWTRFHAGAAGMATAPVNVGALVLTNTASSNSSVAVVDANSGVVSGVGSGTAEIRFGAAQLGNISIAVDTEASVYIERFDVGVYSGLSLQLSNSAPGANDNISAVVELQQGNLSQEGAEGQHFSAASVVMVDSASGRRYVRDVTHGYGATFVSDDAGVAGISGNEFVRAFGSGSTSVYAVLNNTGSCGGSGIVTSRRVDVSVSLPAAIGATMVSVSGSEVHTVTVAHEEDAAYLTGSAAHEVEIRVIVAYPEYERDLTDDARTSIAYSNGTEPPLFTIGECLGGSGTCIRAMGGVSGSGEVRVTFSHEDVEATLTVHVVEGVALTLTPRPFPSYTGSSLVTKSTLRTIGNTGVLQQAALAVTLERSDGQVVSVYPQHGLAVMLVTNEASAVLVTQTSGSDRIIRGGNAGVVTVTSVLGGLTSAAVAVNFSSERTEVTSFGDLRVPGTSGNTVYGAVDVDAGLRLEYGASFDDGTVVSRENMFSVFDSGFRALLARFVSGNAMVLSINNISGSIVPRGNGGERIALTVVSASNAAVTAQLSMYSNLQAAGIDVDLATDSSRIAQLNSLQGIGVNESVEIKVYVTTGSLLVGSLTLDVGYDASLLEFVSVATGQDDTVWGDTVAGEVRSDDSNTVRLGGITTGYASGDNWHFATLTFRSTGVAGRVLFSGYVVEIADATATDLQGRDVAFVAGHNVELVIGDGGTERRERRADDPRGRRHRMQRSSLCVGGAGPYPMGDVNRDCEFSGKDALLTAQFTLVNDDVVASGMFFSANPTVNETAMDADFNGRVDVKDTSVFLYILFGGVRFVRRPELVVEAERGDGNSTCRMIIRTQVEQSSADGTYESDPSRAERTKIAVLFTGGTGVSGQLQALEWQGNSSFVALTGVASAGRSVGYVMADTEEGTGMYAVESSSLVGTDFGISVIQLVQTASGWGVPFGGQYISVGNPYPIEGQTENQDNNLAAVFTIDGTDVAFRYDAAFSPFATMYIPSTHTECVTEAPTSTPSDAPTAVPSDAPSDVPTDHPSQSPTDMPSAEPSVTPSGNPTDMPSGVPSAVPTDEPSDAPSGVPTTPPSDAPSGVPSDTPTDTPSVGPSTSPSPSPSDVPTIIPSFTPTDRPISFSTLVPRTVLVSVNENDTVYESGLNEGEEALFLGLNKTNAISAIAGAVAFGALILILVLVRIRRKNDRIAGQGKLRAKDLRWSQEWRVGTFSSRNNEDDEPDYDDARSVLSKRMLQSSRQAHKQKVVGGELSVGRRVMQPKWSNVPDGPQERNLVWDDSELCIQEQSEDASKLSFASESSRSKGTINLVHMDSQFEDGEYNDVGGLHMDGVDSPEGFMDDGLFDPTSICYDDETYMRVDTEASRLRKLVAADNGEYLASGGGEEPSDVHYLSDLQHDQGGNYREVDEALEESDSCDDTSDVGPARVRGYDASTWISGSSKSHGAGALAALTSLPQDPAEFLRALEADSPDTRASVSSVDLDQFAPAPRRGLPQGLDMKPRGLPDGIELSRRGLPEGVEVSLQSLPDEIDMDAGYALSEDCKCVLEDYMATSDTCNPITQASIIKGITEPQPRVRRPPPIPLAARMSPTTRPALSPGVLSPPQQPFPVQSGWDMSPTVPEPTSTLVGGTGGRMNAKMRPRQASRKHPRNATE